MNAQHTPGPWRYVALGGSSTVLSATRPSRNDTRIPSYGYRDGGEHCVGYPFIGEDRSVRWDFVCFSHEDARLIAAAPELMAALTALAFEVRCNREPNAGPLHAALRNADAAIAKARGEPTPSAHSALNAENSEMIALSRGRLA